MTIRLVAPALAVAALGLVAAPAHATFMPETCSNGGCPGDMKFFNPTANHGVTSFVGSVGSQSGGPAVTVDTFVNTSTAAGYATIKPDVSGTLNALLFTPANSLSYNDFSFRGQIESAGFSNVLTVIVTGCLDVGGVCTQEAPQTFTLTTDKGANADFDRLAIASTDGETIFSVKVETAPGAFFKEFKQVDFSMAGVIPEPAAWTLMLVGFGSLGVALRSRNRASAADA
jgi:hypothetical protein